MTGKELQTNGEKLSTAQLTKLCDSARRGLRDIQTPEEHIEKLLSQLKSAYKSNHIDECAEIFRHILESCSGEIETLKKKFSDKKTKTKQRKKD